VYLFSAAFSCRVWESVCGETVSQRFTVGFVRLESKYWNVTLYGASIVSRIPFPSQPQVNSNTNAGHYNTLPHVDWLLVPNINQDISNWSDPGSFPDTDSILSSPARLEQLCGRIQLVQRTRLFWIQNLAHKCTHQFPCVKEVQNGYRPLLPSTPSWLLMNSLALIITLFIL
jgi:hypothetical protein